MSSDYPKAESQSLSPEQLAELLQDLKIWARELGFQQLGVCDIDLAKHEEHLQHWLESGFHGELDYMQRHGNKRSRPNELIPGTVRVISVRMDYLTLTPRSSVHEESPENAAVSRYAMGRDYHKLMRQRLKQLALRIEQRIEGLAYRVFVDSAPVLERALAEKAGLGWIGKNTMLLNRKAGSYFFLGEIYTNLPLAADPPDSKNHCGDCRACLDICPTQAFVEPYVLDARKCISYLTIELKGSIPEALRPKIGNRIFGCDDCQTICPWNRFAQFSNEADFQPRHNLDTATLIELFAWTESEFLEKTTGSAIRRAGWEGWLRNIAVALGNAPKSSAVIKSLNDRAHHPSALVREHVIWALKQHGE